jgi:hypothetical protein
VSKKVLHVPENVLQTLRQTAVAMGGVELDHLIAAAVWAFSHQDAGLKNLVVSEFWFRGIDNAEPVNRHTRSGGFIHALVRRLYAKLRQYFTQQGGR